MSRKIGFRRNFARQYVLTLVNDHCTLKNDSFSGIRTHNRAQYCENRMNDSQGKVACFDHILLKISLHLLIKNSELNLFAYGWAEYPYPPGQGVLIWGLGSYAVTALT